MKESTPISRRKFLLILTLSLIGSVGGTLLAHYLGAAVQTSPDWLGPAIVIGSLTILIGGLLLLPTLVRAIRASKHGPEA